ncbi:hypothetical protein PIB30_057099 [Stylosanthes scabra]|uniref:Uncharacterized protein n=1 Tax=Stylosanthes scabra TaxID=79078 RepID=A0ABU6WMC5_9FABA|nr:hypothetical protein [Stylosanthes scabra]
MERERDRSRESESEGELEEGGSFLVAAVKCRTSIAITIFETIITFTFEFVFAVIHGSHHRNSELLPLLTTDSPPPLTEEPSPPLSSIVDEVSHLSRSLNLRYLRPLSPSSQPPPLLLVVIRTAAQFPKGFVPSHYRCSSGPPELIKPLTEPCFGPSMICRRQQYLWDEACYRCDVGEVRAAAV